MRPVNQFYRTNQFYSCLEARFLLPVHPQVYNEHAITQKTSDARSKNKLINANLVLVDGDARNIRSGEPSNVTVRSANTAPAVQQLGALLYAEPTSEVVFVPLCE